MDNIISMLDSYFFEYWNLENIDIKSEYKDIPINTFNSVFIYIYDNYVSLKATKDNSNRYINTYNERDFINILRWFKKILLKYNIVSIYGLSLLLGYRKQYLLDIVKESSTRSNENYLWLTVLMIEELQSVFELYQELAVSKLNDSTVGLITNANNNREMGLRYNQQQLVEAYTAKKMIDIADLPKLCDI